MTTVSCTPDEAGAEAANRPARRSLLVLLGTVLAVTVVFAIGHGAYRIPPQAVLAILLDALPGISFAVDAQQSTVLASIRAPRVVLAVLTGAGLAVAGALMQGLFRNPLADPALIGVSAGAALAAACVIVLGGLLLPATLMAGGWLAAVVLPLAAFAGSLAVTVLVYRIGMAHGVLSLPMTLLAGIAINALVGACIGLLLFIASDEQLRTLTFWNLGSLASAHWIALAVAGPLVLGVVLAALALARPLNALSLGESRAAHLGVDVVRTKRSAILLTALATGVLVSLTGVIGFIGLVAPHLIRLVAGPDHRIVIPGAALLGAILVVLADVAARTLVTPAELPIGILTAVLGAPFFLFLLLHRKTHGAR